MGQLFEYDDERSRYLKSSLKLERRKSEGSKTPQRPGTARPPLRKNRTGMMNITHLTLAKNPSIDLKPPPIWT